MNLLRSLVVSSPLTSVLIFSTDLLVTGFLLPHSCCSLLPLANSISRREFIVGSGGGCGFLLSSSASASASSDDSAPMPSSPTISPSSSSQSQSQKNHTNNHRIRWGIVGLGDVTQVKSGPPFWKCKGSDLVAVMRRTPRKAAEFAAKVPRTTNHECCTGYDTLEDLLHHPGGLDAVYVATRPGTHVEIAQQVAEAGMACYVEKPVGRCAAETQALVALFARKSLPLYTAYISRAYERTQMVRKLLHDDGVLGEKLVSVHYVLRGMGGARDMTATDLPWRLDASQSGGGLIMDVGCHILDRIDYLCGPLEQVQGLAEHRVPENDGGHMDRDRDIKNPVENYCHITAIVGATPLPNKGDGGCECEGATVDLTWDFSGTHTNDDDDDIDELRLVGSNGKTLTMVGMSPNGTVQVLDKDGGILETFTFDMPEHTAQRLIQAITNDLLDRKAAPQSQQSPPRVDFLSFGENALRTQRVIDTMLDSYYGGRESGYWSRSWPGSGPESKSKSGRPVDTSTTTIS